MMAVLHKRGKIATKVQILSGSFYKQPEQESTIGWLARGFYQYTIGSVWGSQNGKSEIPKPDESVDYVCVEFLDRQAD